MHKSRKINVAIIGFGLSGRVFHGTLLRAHSGYVVRRVVSTRSDLVQAVFPDAVVSQDVSDVFSDPSIELVVNCAPNAFHFSYSKSALEARKHVLVEKPFVNSVQEGETLIALAKQVRRKLTVFHNRRWDSDFLTVRRLIAAGDLGTITRFESHFDRMRPEVRPERWREQAIEGSGVLYDLGSHLIDQALCLFGKPTQVVARVERQKPASAIDDFFHLTLNYDLLTVVLQSSSLSDSAPRFEIRGSRGTFVKFGLDPQENHMRSEEPYQNGWGAESATQFGKLNGVVVPSEPGNYLRFYDELYKSILEDLPEPVLASEALEVIRLIERARTV